MPAAGRISDRLSCGDFIKTGSADVYADGLPLARENDITTSHSSGRDFWRSVKLVEGSSNVFINNRPATRVGDAAEQHCSRSCHVGKVQKGSPTVFIN